MPGDFTPNRPISARKLSESAEAARRLGNVRGAGGLAQRWGPTGPMVAGLPEGWFPVRLDATDSGSPAQYDWAEVQDDGAGGWADKVNGRSGAAPDFPAYEFNSADADLGGVWPATLAADGQSVLFVSGGGVAGGCAGTSPYLVTDVCVVEDNNQSSTKTSAYALTNDDRNVGADASGGAFALTMPDPAGVTSHEFTVSKDDASGNAVTVSPFAAETFSGKQAGTYRAAAASLTLAARGDSVTLFLDAGGNWRIKASA